MKPLPINHLRAVICSLAGFSLWVISDSCIKLAGEASLPAYEVIGFLGLFAALTFISIAAGRGKVRDLLPASHPSKHIIRGFMAFGCVMSNAVALHHLPLTLFYIVVFTSPMIVVLLATLFLHEHMTVPKILALIAGFAGVLIAIDPWNHFGGGDYIGYIAGVCAATFYALSTILLRKMSQTDTPESLVFSTALVETVLGFGLMLWHFVPAAPMILLILVVMGIFNALGNFSNSYALRYASAATVEQFHYTQIIVAAVVGYIIWHEVPTAPLIAGAVVITVSGIYIAIHGHDFPKTEIDPVLAAAVESQSVETI